MDMDFVCAVELEYGRMVDFSRIIQGQIEWQRYKFEDYNNTRCHR